MKQLLPKKVEMTLEHPGSKSNFCNLLTYIISQAIMAYVQNSSSYKKSNFSPNNSTLSSLSM